MTTLTLHTLASTPEDSKPLLQSSVTNFGWIPNQSVYMSESPALLAAYQNAHDFFSNCSLSEVEKTLVWITVGLENDCIYTVKAHKFIAVSKGVDSRIISAIETRSNNLSDRLMALKNFTLDVIYSKGQLKRKSINAFLNYGFSKRNMLDVILGGSQKNMSTILNSIANTQIDEHFLLENN